MNLKGRLKEPSSWVGLSVGGVAFLLAGALPLSPAVQSVLILIGLAGVGLGVFLPERFRK